MNLKISKLDLNSIKFKLWAYFIAFAVILLCLIWLLQISFLNLYYEEMKSNETSRIANQIKNSFAATDYDIDDLKSTISSMEFQAPQIHCPIHLGLS